MVGPTRKCLKLKLFLLAPEASSLTVLMVMSKNGYAFVVRLSLFCGTKN